MKYPKETLFERIQNRMKASEARKSIKALRHARYRLDIDYMTVKELSELEERYRQNARLAINALREWDVRDAYQKIDLAFRRRERHLLEGQAKEAVSLWMDARRDYRELRDFAMVQWSMRLPKGAANDDGFGDV